MANIGAAKLLESLMASEEQIRSLMENIPEVVWKVDAQGNVIFVSAAVKTVLGYCEAEFYEQGESLWFNAIHPEDRDRVKRGFEEMLNDEPYDIEYRAQRKNGEWFWAHDRAVTTCDTAGVRVTTGLLSDITERKTAEEALQRLAAIVEFSQDAIIGKTVEGVVTSWNRAAERIYGYTAAEAVGRNITFLLPANRHAEMAAILDEVRSGLSVEAFETQRVTKTGSILDVLVAISPIKDAGGHVTGASAIMRDITDRKIAEEQIRFLAYHDALTGLPNRVLVQDRLTNALAGARRRKSKVALLFVDLDRFKLINDSLGHSAGDLLLQEVAKRLRSCTREEDTVARLGGDEFLIVLNDVNGIPEVAIAAERIMDTITTGFVIQDHPLNIRCSLGISIFPEHGADCEALMKNADAAMYSAKESGRNSYRFFSNGMNEESIERLTLENSLRLALQKQQFFLMYQPQMEIATGNITGLEALLRWQNPDVGLVPPAKFIPIAENSGLIEPIGEWVLRTACGQARKWQDDGLPAMSIAVNVSAVQFRQEGFCALVRKVLQETGLAAKYLELELTESLLIADADVTFSVIQELKEIGVMLAIDDFGTGYSSFSHLRRYRFSKLKIDRSFLRDVAVNPDDAAITAAIISMAKSLKLKVIAEGVEDEAQMSFLRLHNCEEIQGYYFSKPLTAEKIAEKLRENALAFNQSHLAAVLG